MVNYKKIYLDACYPNWAEGEFIPCELTGKRAVDIHHIYPIGSYPQMGLLLGNVMAVARKPHEDYGQNKAFLQKLLDYHYEFLKLRDAINGTNLTEESFRVLYQAGANILPSQIAEHSVLQWRHERQGDGNVESLH